MGDLWFVGAGLCDERDLSERAIERLRACDEVFAEEYTAVLAQGALGRLSDRIGRPIVALGRSEVEDGRRIWSALDGGRSVALVVPGDPFAATTHVALRGEAEERGHRWHYLPNASVLVAAPGFLGLMPYRFGRTVSFPFPSAGFEPTSPIEGIRANRLAGLHTLVLLDLDPASGRYLTGPEALGTLVDRDPGRTLLPSGTRVGLLARVGTETARAWYGEVDRLRSLDAGPPMHCLVVPAPELHFVERAAVERFLIV
ncbi:MAG TPA: diphthine synthase [Thermoplasmata archaeon]|nr:diphthine synthase [Thermoplasmata archaeon]